MANFALAATGMGSTALHDLSQLVTAPGANSMDYRDPVFPAQPIRLHAARPLAWTPAMPVLFVHHGVRRNGRDYRDYWLPHVDPGGFLAIAIEFPNGSFPEYLWYNFGNLHAKDGSPNPRVAWTFGVGPRLFDALRDQGITTAPHHALFGHSAGGQYVHRMLSLGYRKSVAVAVTANAGTYAMPDLDIDWPWGVGALGLTPDDVGSLLRFPLTIMAGTEDIKTTGAHFPGGPRSMRQGPHRYARAHAYFEMGQAAARSLSLDLAWSLIDVPGVGHDGGGMSNAAAPVIAERLRNLPE